MIKKKRFRYNWAFMLRFSKI